MLGLQVWTTKPGLRSAKDWTRGVINAEYVLYLSSYILSP